MHNSCGNTGQTVQEWDITAAWKTYTKQSSCSPWKSTCLHPQYKQRDKNTRNISYIIQNSSIERHQIYFLPKQKRAGCFFLTKWAFPTNFTLCVGGSHFVQLLLVESSLSQDCANRWRKSTCSKNGNKELWQKGLHCYFLLSGWSIKQKFHLLPLSFLWKNTLPASTWPLKTSFIRNINHQLHK